MLRAKEKIVTIETILTRTAETVGDLTDPVISLYFKRMPEARELFDFHGFANSHNLEGQMVEQALYCLMYWHDSPGEIEILLLGSVPHHSDTLNVPAGFYSGLLTATADVVAQSIPGENSEELAVWNEVHQQILAIIEESRQFTLPARAIS